MNLGIRLITILSLILLISVSLAWTDSTTVRLPSGQTHLDKVGSTAPTPLADDNKIVCCWKCPDDGLMKCKVTSVSFCNKMGRQVSSCGECQ